MNIININFFNKYKSNLNKNGCIVTDNLSFHGLVEDNTLIKTKNQRGIVNKIKESKIKIVVDVLEPVIYIILLILVTSFLIDASFNPFLYFRF